MSVSVETKTMWNDDKLKTIAQKVIADSVWDIALMVESQAKQLAPVKTGRLRGSITVQMDDRSTQPDGLALAGDVINKPSEKNTALVGTAVDYASHMEFGTVKTDAQPFLRPALDLAEGKALSLVESNGRQQFAEYLK